MKNETVCKTQFIVAYVSACGGTKKAASVKFTELPDDFKREIVNEYFADCKKAFYND